MLKHIGTRHTQTRILDQSRADETFGLQTQFGILVRLEIEIAFRDDLAHVVHVVSVERKVTVQEGEDHDGSAPDIDFLVVGLLHQDFWGDVARASEAVGEQAPGLGHLRCIAEIAQLDVGLALVD